MSKNSTSINQALKTSVFLFQVAPITKDHKNARKSRLNVTPITIRPKSLKEKPTYVAVKQKRSSDITYGRIESTPSYTLHHAVTEKPRDDIIIEVTPLEDENNGLPEQQENDEESFKEDTKEMVSDIAQTDRYERTNEVSCFINYTNHYRINYDFVAFLARLEKIRVFALGRLTDILYHE